MNKYIVYSVFVGFCFKTCIENFQNALIRNFAIFAIAFILVLIFLDVKFKNFNTIYIIIIKGIVILLVTTMLLLLII